MCSDDYDQIVVSYELFTHFLLPALDNHLFEKYYMVSIHKFYLPINNSYLSVLYSTQYKCVKPLKGD